MILLNKLFVLFRCIKRDVISFVYTVIFKFFAKGIVVGKGVCFHGNNYIASTDGGSIEFGNNVQVCRGVKIVSQNASIIIGDNVHVGDGSIIVAKESVFIGNDVLIGDYVVIRDQAHCTDVTPIRIAGFSTSPIRIESGVWVGAKATILKGVTISEDSVIGAHAMVNSSVPARSLSAGVPARVLKKL